MQSKPSFLGILYYKYSDLNKKLDDNRNEIFRIPLGDEFNKVALLTYSTESFIQLNLDHSLKHDEMFALIDQLPLIKQRTNVSGKKIV